jgi:hypothetical protein
MLIFGDRPSYLSHLPMFHPPHDRQLVIEVEFNGTDDPAELYRRDRAETSERIYTWVPKPFVLDDLVNASGTAEMTGRIFRGHFERKGVPITGFVTCVVSRLIHSHTLSAAGPRDSNLRYLLFGGRESAFAVHVISGPPDFDHVISVDIVSAPARIPGVVVVQERPNDPARRVQRHERVRMSGSTEELTVQCLDEIYVEIGELAS